MDRLIIAVILALIPIISFLLNYFISIKKNKFHIFKKHIPVAYLDWIFVPFNFIVAYIIDIDYTILSFFIIIAILGNLFVHECWYSRTGKPKNYFYDDKTKKISSTGVLHIVYSSIQTSIILSFIGSKIGSVSLFSISLALLAAYFIGRIPSSIIMHKKMEISDLIVTILGFIAIIAKALSVFVAALS